MTEFIHGKAKTVSRPHQRLTAKGGGKKPTNKGGFWGVLGG